MCLSNIEISDHGNAEAYVSILVLMDVPLESAWDMGATAGTTLVSILVLMDVPLE